MTKRSRETELAEHMARVVALLRSRALRGVFDGRASGVPYMLSCSVDDAETQTRLIYTRDTGHHTSGWMRNPDYERCLHLSTSPFPSKLILLSKPEPDRRIQSAWVKAFFGPHLAHVWAESPKSSGGITRGVWHWRAFCDEQWQPIVPRKEVYSSEFTEKGFRSASELFEEEGRVILSTVDPT